MFEGSLEVKLPTIWTDGKAEVGRVREEKKRSEEIREREKKESVGVQKGRKVTVHIVFPTICGSGGSKSRLGKAAGAEPAGQMRDEKLHAVVARSTFGRRKTKNTSRSDHFWKLRCQKSARCCGAKHISKSKCTKHNNVGPRWEVEMSKKCTQLWREAHFEVKSVKTEGVRTAFGRFARQAQGIMHLVQSEQNVRVCSSFNYNYTTTLYDATQHSTPLHSTTLHYTHYTTLHSTSLHFTTLHYTTLHYTKLHYTNYN